TVAAVGREVTNLTVGQTVAVEPNYSCGVCPLCREGNRNLCLSRVAVGIDVDGGFAEQATVPARCCWPAADRLAAGGGGARGRAAGAGPRAGGGGGGCSGRSRWRWWCAPSGAPSRPRARRRR